MVKRLQQRKLLGQRVRALRQCSGMTQEQLGNAAKLFRTYIARIESGSADPTVSVLLRLADALGVTVHDLFAVTDQTERRTPDGHGD